MHWALLVLSVGAPACVPLEELDGYSAGGSASNVAGPQSTATPSPPKPDASVGVSPTLPEDRANSDGLPRADAELERPQPLEPSAGPEGVVPVCDAACGVADAGVVAVPVPELDAAPPPPPVCAADETTGPNGRCYVAVATPLAWEAARANCQARGAGWDLASIRSSTDSDLLHSLLADEVWVGGSDAAVEGTWTWVDDGFEFWQGEGVTGSPLNMAFIAWFPDEPNGEDSSDCLRLLLDSLWADLECAESLGSVCEGPPG